MHSGGRPEVHRTQHADIWNGNKTANCAGDVRRTDTEVPLQTKAICIHAQLPRILGLDKSASFV
jgi:hypothetical protein